jgi:hypothetical protein
MKFQTGNIRQEITTGNNDRKCYTVHTQEMLHSIYTGNIRQDILGRKYQTRNIRK